MKFNFMFTMTILFVSIMIAYCLKAEPFQNRRDIVSFYEHSNYQGCKDFSLTIFFLLTRTSQFKFYCKN
jgi:hypothetical protein